MTPVSLLAAWMATSGRPSERSWRSSAALSAARSSTPSLPTGSASTRSLAKRPPESRHGMIGRGDVEPRHANSAAAHLPVRRQQRRRRFGRAGREDDMLGLGADERRDRAPRLLDQAARRASLAVDRGRIGVDVQRGKHRRPRRRQQRCACIVVEIGARCGHHPSNLPVIPPIRGRQLYFLEFPRSAVLFTRFADGAVPPPSFEQF